MTIIIPRTEAVRVRQEGTRVLVISQDGQTLLDLPYGGALELAKVLHSQAKKAEQLAKINTVIDDQAILMRAGWPIALTNRPDALKIAGNEAAWNSDLRRYMRQSKLDQVGEVYAPVVKQDEPEK